MQISSGAGSKAGNYLEAHTFLFLLVGIYFYLMSNFPTIYIISTLFKKTFELFFIFFLALSTENSVFKKYITCIKHCILMSYANIDYFFITLDLKFNRDRNGCKDENDQCPISDQYESSIGRNKDRMLKNKPILVLINMNDESYSFFKTIIKKPAEFYS